MIPVNIEDLKKVIALSELPDEHLQWIVDRCEYEEIADGGLVAKFGDPADKMWIALEGKISFYMNVNGRQVFYFTFENNDVTGGVGGLMPYSRMKTIPGYAYAVGKVKILRLHKDHFTELEHLNPDLIKKLIGYMTERAKSFATLKLQHEKVNALGNLAAGIAHELNNPAAAINRFSNELAKRLNLNYKLTERLLKCNISSEHMQRIQTLVAKKEIEQTQKVKLTASQRLQNEEELEEWLEKHGVTERQPAETFSEFGFSTSEFESLLIDIEKDVIICLVPWLENLISSKRIIEDLTDASNRIYFLVASIKSHVHMDRTNDMQTTNIQNDLENTLTLLGFKLREKNIEVKKNFSDNMKDIPAYVGELNQVWTNLIDNAIFALPKNGELVIETSIDQKNLKVNIIDNGPGIPKDILSRIFDPFFTTKKVGEGTGIGLDIVSRIIKHHKGEIKVSSEPGRTVFSVILPVEEINESKTIQNN
ncbi:MAG: GHKL domain-containing protein [Ignavibacteria bacterium]|nr:GHKL domain-containing protein [Ignavibacteria bacterium]